MKDSRLGTYGVVGLILILSLKFLLLLELMQFFPIELVAVALIAAQANSRFWATTIMQKLPYVQDIDTSKSKPLADRILTKAEMGVLALGSLVPLTLVFILIYSTIDQLDSLLFSYGFASWLFFFILWVQVPAYLVQIFAGNYFMRWIGGYTGDCLGTTQQVCEIAFYLGCLLLWKFI